MRVLVAEFGTSMHLHEVAMESVARPELYRDILYLPLGRRTNLRQLDGIIPVSWRRRADVVIIRAHRPEASEIKTDSRTRERLAHRFEDRPIWLLEWEDTQHALVPLATQAHQVPPAVQPELIRALRSAELMALTRRPGVMLPAMPNFHYVGPNGSHYPSFLRAGTALQSLDALDDVVFWLLPHLTQPTVLLLDSPTILAVGLNCARYLIEHGEPYTNIPSGIEHLRYTNPF